MIGSIKISNLRNAEFIQFLKDISGVMGKNNPALLNVQLSYDRLQAIVISLETYFKMPKGSALTPGLQKLDLQRNNSFRGLKNIINGHRYSTNAAISTSAVLLADYVAIYGANLTRDNYFSKTARISSIVKDWETNPALAMALAHLGLQDCTKELTNANNLFSEQYLARVSETVITSAGSLQATRFEASRVYYQLRDELNALYIIQKGADPFGSAVNFINGLLENYNHLLNRRSGGEEAPVAVAGTA